MLDPDLRDLGARADLAAVRKHSFHQRSRQPLRSTCRRAMREAAAVEPVVDQGETRARGHRAQRDTVDGDAGDGCIERLGFEPLLGELDGRHRQAAHHAEHVLAAHAPQLQCERGERQAVRAQVDLRQARHRRRIRGIEKYRSAIHAADELRPARGIARGEPSDGFDRGHIGCARDQPQRVAVRQRGDVGRLVGARRETVPGEVEFLDDRGAQLTRRMQARHDGAGCERGARQLPTGGCALFEHQHFLARLGEVGSGDQAVVARTDDQDVRVRHRAPTASP